MDSKLIDIFDAGDFALAEGYYKEGLLISLDDQNKAFEYFRAARRHILTSDTSAEAEHLQAAGADGIQFVVKMNNIWISCVTEMISIVTGKSQNDPLVQLILTIAIDADLAIAHYPNIIIRNDWHNKREEDVYTDYTYECVRYSMYKANQVLSTKLSNEEALRIFKLYSENLVRYYSFVPWGVDYINEGLLRNNMSARWELYGSCISEYPEPLNYLDDTALLAVFSGVLQEALGTTNRQLIFEGLVDYNDPNFWDKVEERIMSLKLVGAED